MCISVTAVIWMPQLKREPVRPTRRMEPETLESAYWLSLACGMAAGLFVWKPLRRLLPDSRESRALSNIGGWFFGCMAFLVAYSVVAWLGAAPSIGLTLGQQLLGSLVLSAVGGTALEYLQYDWADFLWRH